MEVTQNQYSIDQIKEILDGYGVPYHDLSGASNMLQLGETGEHDTSIHCQKNKYVCYTTDEDYDDVVYALRGNDVAVGLNFKDKSKEEAAQEISSNEETWQGKIVTVFHGNAVLNPSSAPKYQPHCIYAYGNEAFDELLQLLLQGRSKLAMTKIDAVWVGTAVLTYEICQQKTDWNLADIGFPQQDIVKAAKEIISEEIPNALVSSHATANSSSQNKNCAYLTEADDKKRRLTYLGEYDGAHEHPNVVEMKDNITISTKAGSITVQQLFDFVKDVYTPRMQELLKGVNQASGLKKEKAKMNNKPNYDKNLILYGPPGTGKTYNSVNYAVAICEGKTFEEVRQENYDDVLVRFDALKKAGRIAFTTFHQSYGYEEFIEGIKPVTDEQTGNISYEIVDGLFKEFCDKNGKSVDSREAFENAWDKLVEKADEDDNKFKFTRRTGTIVEATYLNDDKFRVEWNGGTHNDLTKTAIFNQWTDIDTVRESFKGGNRWLYDARLAVIDELKKQGLPDYDSKAGQASVFIIDEINRGNISKIFGELITLIEDTKRKGCAEKMNAVLPYSHTEFSVPDNVYILGTMNTADRSIALMDTALRRRFSFVEMMPNSEVLESLGVGTITDGNQELNVSEMLNVINRRIEYLYDREHTIGHAFFTKLKDAPNVETLGTIFKKNVIPLLQEYFYEDYAKIQYVLGDNQKEDALKFILDETLDVKDIFNGVPDIDLPEKKYRIQESSFHNLASYKGIGKNL